MRCKCRRKCKKRWALTTLHCARRRAMLCRLRAPRACIWPADPSKFLRLFGCLWSRLTCRFRRANPYRIKCCKTRALTLSRDRRGWMRGRCGRSMPCRRFLNAALGRGDFTLELGGHTDAQGDLDANNRLSLSRARAVLSALEARGVPTGAIVAKGYGPSQPIADNGTAQGRAENRRTTVVWAMATAEAPLTQTTTQGETN